jgi:hypothetical protein
MRDLEFAGFIARLGESMSTDDFAYMIAHSEDRHAQQGQAVGVILNQAPPVSIVEPKQNLKLAQKRKAPSDEDRDEQDYLPTKRKIVQASSAEMTEANWDWLTTPSHSSLSDARATRTAGTSPAEIAVPTPHTDLQTSSPIGYTIPRLQLAPQVPAFSGSAKASTLLVFARRRALRLHPVVPIPATYSATPYQQTAVINFQQTFHHLLFLIILLVKS